MGLFSTFLGNDDKKTEQMKFAAQYQQPIQPAQYQQNTVRDTLATLQSLTAEDPQRGFRMQADFAKQMSDPSSSFYDAFSLNASNKAVSNLQAMGIDIGNDVDKWLKDNKDLMQYYKFTDTNKVKTPGKDASLAEQVAYQYHQIDMAQSDTAQAVQESKALQEEIAFLTNGPWNYSDEEILARAKNSVATKYGKLRQMQESNDKREPIQLNQAVALPTDDWIYSQIFATRNGGSTGSAWNDMAEYASRGAELYQADPAMAAKLTPGTDEYAPYSVGSTMTDECLLFGKYYFEPDWCEKNRKYQNGTAQERAAYDSIYKAEKTTQKAETEKAKLKARIEQTLQGVTNVDTARKWLDKIHKDKEYSTLWAMDESLEQSPDKIMKLTRAVDYRWQDMEAFAMGIVEANNGKQTGTEVQREITRPTAGTAGRKGSRMHPEGGAGRRKESPMRADETPQSDTQFAAQALVEEEYEKTRQVEEQANQLAAMREKIAAELQRARNPEYGQAQPEAEPDAVETDRSGEEQTAQGARDAQQRRQEEEEDRRTADDAHALAAQAGSVNRQISAQEGEQPERPEAPGYTPPERTGAENGTYNSRRVRELETQLAEVDDQIQTLRMDVQKNTPWMTMPASLMTDKEKAEEEEAAQETAASEGREPFIGTGMPGNLERMLAEGSEAEAPEETEAEEPLAEETTEAPRTPGSRPYDEDTMRTAYDRKYGKGAYDTAVAAEKSRKIDLSVPANTNQITPENTEAIIREKDRKIGEAYGAVENQLSDSEKNAWRKIHSVSMDSTFNFFRNAFRNDGVQELKIHAAELAMQRKGKQHFENAMENTDLVYTYEKMSESLAAWHTEYDDYQAKYGDVEAYKAPGVAESTYDPGPDGWNIEVHWDYDADQKTYVPDIDLSFYENIGRKQYNMLKDWVESETQRFNDKAKVYTKKMAWLEEQDQATHDEIDRYRELSVSIKDADAYVESYREEYEQSKAAIEEDMRGYNVLVDSLEELGVDTTELRNAEGVLDYLSGLYKLPPNEISNMGKLQTIRLSEQEYGVELSSGEESQMLHEGIDSIDYELAEAYYALAFLENTGYKIPDSQMNHLKRQINRLEFQKQAYEYDTILTDTDPEELQRCIAIGEQFDSEYNRVQDTWNGMYNNTPLEGIKDTYSSLERKQSYIMFDGTMTQDELDIYHYLLGKSLEGYEGDLERMSEEEVTELMAASNDYYGHLIDDSYGILTRRLDDERSEYWAKQTREHAVEANLAATVMAPAEIIMKGALSLGLLSDPDYEYNQYDPRLGVTKMRAITREETNQMIDEEFEGKSPILKWLAKTGYEIYVNRGDSFMTGKAFGFMNVFADVPILGDFLGAVPMAFSAAWDSYGEAKQRGVDDATAFAMAGIGFFAESITEAVTLDNIKDALGFDPGDTTEGLTEKLKDFVKEWLTENGVEEALGESASNIIEDLGDYLILPDKGEFGELQNYYMRTRNVDEAEAFYLVMTDKAKDLVHTAVVSYLGSGLDVVVKGAKYAGAQLSEYRTVTNGLQRNGYDVSLMDVIGADLQNKRTNGPMQSLAEDQVRVLQAKQEHEKKNRAKAETETQAETQAQTETTTPAPSRETQAQGSVVRTGVSDMRMQDAAAGIPRAETRQTETEAAIAANRQQAAADVIALEQTKTGDLSVQTAALAEVLSIGDGSDPNEDLLAKAAATSLADRLGENGITRVQEILTEAAKNGFNNDAIKRGLQMAALGEGETARVVGTEAFRAASPLEQVKAISSAMLEDATNDEVHNKMSAAAEEFRATQKIMARAAEGAFDEAQAKQATADAAAAETRKAEEELGVRQEERQAKADALEAAGQEMANNPTPDNVNALTHAVNEHEAALVHEQEYQQHLENTQEAQTRAEDEARQATETAMKEVRQDVQEEMLAEDDAAAQARIEAEAQQAQAQAEAAQAQAEAERQRIIDNQRSGVAEEESAEQKLRRLAEERGYKGEEADKFVNDAMNYFKNRRLGKIDTTRQFTASEGYLAMSALSRRFGVNVVLADIHGKENGYYDRGTNTITLNKNLPAGQVMLEFGLHELTHALEQTDAYDKYRSTALEILYPSEAELNEAVGRKMAEYEDAGHPIDRAQAERELVADFTRTKLNDKSTVNRMVDAGLGGRIRNALHNVNQLMKNMKLKGADKVQAESLRRAERMFQKAIRQNAKQNVKNALAEARGAGNERTANAGREYSVTGEDAADMTAAQTHEMMKEAQSDYQSAVERGDMAAAQEDVDFAAEEAMPNSKIRDENGKLLTVYHGTNENFNVFDTSVSGGKNGNAEGFGIYLTDDADVSDDYGNRQISAYLNMQRPAYSDSLTLNKQELANLIKQTCEQQAQVLVDEEGYGSAEEALPDTWISNYVYTPEYGDINDAYAAAADAILGTNDNDADVVNEILMGMGIRTYEEAMDFYHNILTPTTGVDGIATKWTNQKTGKESNIYLAFDSSQIKSNDTVTYDDNGNVIPLEQRFNDQNPDIRYSVGDGEMTNAQMDQTLVDAGIISQEDAEREYSVGGTEGGEGATPQRQFGRVKAQGIEGLRQEVKDFLYNNSAYDKDTNDAQVDRAVDWMTSHASEIDPEGFWSSMQEVEKRNFNPYTADGQAKMYVLMSAAAKLNNTEAQIKIADMINQQGTTIGQALQARKLYRLMTPEGRMSVLTQEVDKLNDQLRNQGKEGNIKLDELILQAAAAAQTEQEFAQAKKAMQEELGRQIPPTWKDKLQTWRMTSMLANPRTHVRNFVGNALFVPVVEIKNAVGTGIERLKIKDGEERTKSIIHTKESKEFAKQDVQEMRDVLTGEAKYKQEDLIRQNMKAFGRGEGLLSRTIGKGVQALSDFNINMLEKEDWIFLNRHYQNALASYMTANKLTADDMKGETLNKARNYAVLEAQKATYRDANETASMLNKVSQKGGIKGFLVDSLLPFKKTPANILRRGMEYSPVQLLKNVVTAKRDVDLYKAWEANGKKGEMDPRARSMTQVIDSWASSLTGTGIAAIGAWLAASGHVKLSFGDEDDDELDKERGSQEYSVEFFGHSFTVDWTAPACMPFFFGAALYENLSKDVGDIDLGSAFGATIDTISRISEPIFNLSMLDSVNSVLETVSYSNSGLPIGDIVQKVVTNRITSYVPSALGAVARTVDTTRRKSFVESGAKGSMWYLMNEQVENKIPFLSMKNIPYRNVWGEAEQSSFVESMLENFIMPGYHNNVEDTAITQELQRVYDATGGDKSVIPQTAGKKVGGTALTDKEYDQYVVTRGQTAKRLLTELFDRPEYQALNNTNPQAQASLITNVWEYANAISRKEQDPNYELKSWIKNAYAAGEGKELDTLFEHEEEKAKSDAKAQYKADMFQGIEMNDAEAITTNLQGMKSAGATDKSIRSTLTSEYKQKYIQAYRDGDYETMDRIESSLMLMDLGDSSYKEKDFEKWLNGIETEND